MREDCFSNDETSAGRYEQLRSYPEDRTDHDDGWFAGTIHDCLVPTPGQCLECALVIVWAQHKARTA